MIVPAKYPSAKGSANQSINHWGTHQELAAGAIIGREFLFPGAPAKGLQITASDAFDPQYFMIHSLENSCYPVHDFKFKDQLD